MFRVEVFDLGGKPLGELDHLVACKWATALNKSAQATFDISINHPKATSQMLAKFNNVIIHHDILSPWTGFITSVHWANTQTIQVTCDSTLQRLGQRRSEVHNYRQHQPGTIFMALLTQANARAHTGIYGKTIETGTQAMDFQVRRENIYSKIQDLLDQAKLELSIEYIPISAYSTGLGHWEATLTNKVGADLTAQVFIAGGYETVGDVDYPEEMSDFANAITGIGKKKDNVQVPEGEDEYNYRPQYEYVDWNSVAEFGLVEDTVEYSDTEDEAALEKLVREEVAKRGAGPKTTLGISISNRRDMWGQFSDGDIIACQLPYYGFGGLVVPVRVLGREVDDYSDKMTLALDVVRGTEATGLDMYKFAHYSTTNGYAGTGSYTYADA